MSLVSKKNLSGSIISGVLLIVLISRQIFAVGLLPGRSLEISSSQPSDTNVQYLLSFNTTSSYAFGSLVIEFCQNDPIPGTACIPSPGFDASAAVLQSQAGVTGFSISPLSTSNKIILTRTATVEAPNFNAYLFMGITNPSATGTNYARLQTFSSTDGSGSAIDQGGVTYSIQPLATVSLVVPPYLYFCAAETIPGYDCSNATNSFVDFGELSTVATKTATSQLLVATNGQFGVNISVTGTTLTSGNNIINALAVPTTSQIGTSQFGFNLVTNTNPAFGSDAVGNGVITAAAGYATPNQFKFMSGDIIAASATTTAEKKFTVSYIVNIAKNQSPGLYSTTLLYTALASF